MRRPLSALKDFGFKFAFFIFALSALSFTGGCAEKTTKAEVKSIPVRVIEAGLEDIKVTEQFVGEIKAFDEAAVYPRVSGKIKEKLKQEGDAVAKDEILMYVDRDEIGFEFMPSPVTAPLSGLIGNIYVDKGDSVTVQTAVANIINIEKVKIKVNIPERYFSFVRPAQKVRIEVDAYPDEEFEGGVSMISPQVDTLTRTFPVEMVVSNEGGKLKPGMFTRAQMTMKESRQAVVIPREAVLRSGSEAYVFVVEGDTARKRAVRLGIEKLEEAEVVSGISQGDLVVVAGQGRIEDGLKVAVVTEAKR